MKALAGLFLFLLSVGLNAAEPVPDTVTALDKIWLPQQHNAPAKVFSLNTPEISAEIAAPVIETSVNVGDVVTKGDVLIRLDCKNYLIQHRINRASLERSAAQVAFARSQLVRANNLKKKTNIELAQKNALITEQKKEITDSIQYASRIQNAMLPPGDYIDSLLPERFIIYKPRDIVSGDFYYITEKDDKIICVISDCTGHGVPGAFMSMLGISFLNEIIIKHRDLPHSNEILEELRAHVIKSLHQT